MTKDEFKAMKTEKTERLLKQEFLENYCHLGFPVVAEEAKEQLDLLIHDLNRLPTIVPNEKWLSGAQVYIRGEGIVPDQVALHNRLMAKRLNKPWIDYTHSETLYWDEDENQLYTFGAREKGAERSRVQDYYNKGHKIMIKLPVVPLYRDDNYALKEFFIKMDPTKYQHIALLSWIADIKLLGHVPEKVFKNKRRNYCYKLTAKASKVIQRWPVDKSTDKVSIFDLNDNPLYYLP